MSVTCVCGHPKEWHDSEHRQGRCSECRCQGFRAKQKLRQPREERPRRVQNWRELLPDEEETYDAEDDN